MDIVFIGPSRSVDTLNELIQSERIGIFYYMYDDKLLYSSGSDRLWPIKTWLKRDYIGLRRVWFDEITQIMGV